MINMKLLSLLSYVYLIPASLHRLSILLKPLPNCSIVLLKKRILAILGFLISDSKFWHEKSRGEIRSRTAYGQIDVHL